jgi:hypothetical protein
MKKNLSMAIAVGLLIGGLSALGYTSTKWFAAIQSPHGTTSVGDDIMMAMYLLTTLCTIASGIGFLLSLHRVWVPKRTILIALIINLCAIIAWTICHLSESVMTYMDFVHKIKGM